MSIDTGVRLESNGAYWTAAWKDSRGKTVRKSIGAKATYSKQAARAACNRLAVEHGVQPARRDIRHAPTLAAWTERYLTLRTDLRDSTRQMHGETIAYLKAFFQPELPIDRITRAGASDWRAWLTRQPARKPEEGERDDPETRPRVSECTVCRHVRTAKVIFARACDDDLLAASPFEKLNGTAPHADAEFQTVSRDDLGRILERCPSPAWRALFALCRLAGLRQGEATRLTWADVALDNGTILVLPEADDDGRRRETTKQRRRVVPIEPALSEILEACRAEAPGDLTVCPVPVNNLRRQANKIIRRAGLTPYPKPFHTLRKNLETEWLDKHPVMTVCKWLGNSPAVAARHYQKPTAESIAKVTGKPVLRLTESAVA